MADATCYRRIHDVEKQIHGSDSTEPQLEIQKKDDWKLWKHLKMPLEREPPNGGGNTVGETRVCTGLI